MVWRMFSVFHLLNIIFTALIHVKTSRAGFFSIAFYLVQFPAFMLGEQRRKSTIRCCQGRKWCWASTGTNKGAKHKRWDLYTGPMTSPSPHIKGEGLVYLTVTICLTVAGKRRPYFSVGMQAGRGEAGVSAVEHVCAS